MSETTQAGNGFSERGLGLKLSVIVTELGLERECSRPSKNINCPMVLVHWVNGVTQYKEKECTLHTVTHGSARQQR